MFDPSSVKGTTSVTVLGNYIGILLEQTAIRRQFEWRATPGGEFFQANLRFTIVLNLAVGLFALDTLVVITVMPTVVGDIGGTEYYSWTIMLYMVGSIVGAASAGPVKELLGRRKGYVYAGLLLLQETSVSV